MRQNIVDCFFSSCMFFFADHMIFDMVISLATVYVW